MLIVKIFIEIVFAIVDVIKFIPRLNLLNFEEKKMIYRILIVTILQIVTHLTLFAQDKLTSAQATSLITGVVRDSIDHSQIIEATVYFLNETDSLILQQVITTVKGDFKISGVRPGQYQIKVSMMGYDPVLVPNVVVMANGSDIVLDTVFMRRRTQLLKAVNVSTQKPLVKNKIDGLLYDVESDPTLAGGNAADALRKVPLLAVGVDGKVSFRGNSNIRILVNGRRSAAMDHNSADALGLLSADQIKSIELITSPSSKYDGDGSVGIVNIITKRNVLDGINGSIAGALGSRQNNFSGTVNARSGKLGFTANTGRSWSWPVMTLITFDQLTDIGEKKLSQQNASKNMRGGLQSAIAMDFEIDSNNMLISNFNLNQSSIGTENDMMSEYAGVGFQRSVSEHKLQFRGIDLSVDYQKKFSRKGQELTISSQLLRGNNITDYTTFYHNRRFFPSETGYNKGRNKDVTIQADFILPIRSQLLELGAKTIYRDIVSDIDNTQNYIFEYQQHVSAAYATLSLPIGKRFEVKSGIRYEQTLLEGNPVGNITGFINNYYNFFPNVVVGYKSIGGTTFKASYNKRIQRPSLYYLNPFRNTSDPINQLVGNPKLKPELSHNISLGADLTLPNTMLNLSTYYRKTTNVIESIYTNIIQDNDPIVLQSFGNVGASHSFGASIFTSITVFKIISLRGSVDLYSFSIKPIAFYDLQTDLTNKVFMNYKTFLGVTANFKNGLIADSYLFFDSPQRTFQGYYSAFNLWNISLKKKILKDQATIGLTAVDPFTKVKNLKSYASVGRFEQHQNMALPFRSFGITCSWKFGKSNSANGDRHRRINNDDLKAGGQL
jgi:ferric enterobactin receptor